MQKIPLFNFTLKEEDSIMLDTFDNRIKNVKDLSSISKYYDPEYTLGPFDIGLIKHNKDGIKQLYQKGEKLEEELLECNNLCTCWEGHTWQRSCSQVQ